VGSLAGCAFGWLAGSNALAEGAVPGQVSKAAMSAPIALPTKNVRALRPWGGVTA